MFFGPFFTFSEIQKIEHRATVKKLWFASLITLITLYIYFIGINFFHLKKWLNTYLLLFLLLLPLLVSFTIIKKDYIKNFMLIFWQIYYSFFVIGILLLLIVNENIGFLNILLILLGSLAIYSYPYVFFLVSNKSWIKYIVFFFILVTFILFIIAPNAIVKASIQFSRIGNINYKTIVIDDKVCTDLNRYFSHKPCLEDHKLINLKGLWLQGNVYLFEDKNHTQYKIHKDNIIYMNTL